MSGTTLPACLAAIGVDVAALSDCQMLSDEWAIIKKAYFKMALRTHPDKGGDPEEFRKVQASFEVLRELFDNGDVSSFTGPDAGSFDTGDAFESNFQGFGAASTPSWEFYEEAAQEPVPAYRVEAAKSGRSACKQKGSAKKCGPAEDGLNLIAKGETRVGSIDMESGSYGRWCHLQCWRVPSKVWLGLPDPDETTDPLAFEAALVGMNEVLLSGVKDLSEDARAKFVAYVMDRSNWAKKTNRKSSATPSSYASSSSSMVKWRLL